MDRFIDKLIIHTSLLTASLIELGIFNMIGYGLNMEYIYSNTKIFSLIMIVSGFGYFISKIYYKHKQLLNRVFASIFCILIYHNIIMYFKNYYITICIIAFAFINVAVIIYDILKFEYIEE